MADILILHAKDSERTAALLAAALGNAGYRAMLDQPSPATAPLTGAAERVRAARAVIVVWSKRSAASGTIHSAAGEARRRRTLIQAVTDEGKVPRSFADGSSIPLAGWGGEESHPGLQRIVGAVKRLCGSAGAAPSPPPAPKRRKTAAAEAKPQRPLIATAGILLSLSAAVGAAVWLNRDAPPAPTAESVGQAPPPAPEPFAAPAPPPAQPPAPVDTPPPPAADTAPPPPPRVKQSPAPTAERRARSYDAKRTMRLFCDGAGRSTRECRAFRRREGAAAAPPRQPAPAYKYSENMRLFCEGAGRRTRECRTFRRRTRQ